MDTDSAEILFRQGTRLLEASRHAQAERVLRLALRIAPELAPAHANLALVLERGQRHAEAEMHYRRAAALQPGEVAIGRNYGAMLARLKRFPEAETVYRQALLTDPTAVQLWSNLGALLASTAREPQAEDCLRRAIALQPGYHSAHFNLAYLLLRQGRYAEGWACLEYRPWQADFGGHSVPAAWQGQALAGKSLLIGCEGGYGDMIQMVRYLAPIAALRPAAVTVVCQAPLRRLFASLAGVDAVLWVDTAGSGRGGTFGQGLDAVIDPATDPAPAPGIAHEASPGREPGSGQGPTQRPPGALQWDYRVAPLSLPGIFGTRADSIPAALPYLHATPADLAHWSRRLASPGTVLRVGLAWRGNPLFENDAERSLPSLAILAPLWQVPGVRFYSLQKTPGQAAANAEAAKAPDCALDDLGPELGDFADTAAAVMQLDLVISVDTAVAHLSGALGVPCWVLLSDFCTDWRWGAHGSTSPWYPQVMRLFRKSAPGGWAQVVEQVAAALRERASQP